MADRYEPKTKLVFWCNECDSTKIDSTDASTGQFYIQFGHRFIHAPFSDAPPSVGEELGVVFALCPNCDK